MGFFLLDVGPCGSIVFFYRHTRIVDLFLFPHNDSPLRHNVSHKIHCGAVLLQKRKLHKSSPAGQTFCTASSPKQTHCTSPSLKKTLRTSSSTEAGVFARHRPRRRQIAPPRPEANALHPSSPEAELARPRPRRRRFALPVSEALTLHFRVFVITHFSATLIVLVESLLLCVLCPSVQKRQNPGRPLILPDSLHPQSTAGCAQSFRIDGKP